MGIWNYIHFNQVHTCMYKRFIRTIFPDSCIKPAHKLPENSSFAPKSLSSDKWLLPFNRASSLIHINLLIHFWLCKYSVFIQPRILCEKYIIRLSSLWWCKENRFWYNDHLKQYYQIKFAKFLHTFFNHRKNLPHV